MLLLKHHEHVFIYVVKHFSRIDWIVNLRFIFRWYEFTNTINSLHSNDQRLNPYQNEKKQHSDCFSEDILGKGKSKLIWCYMISKQAIKTYGNHFYSIYFIKSNKLRGVCFTPIRQSVSPSVLSFCKLHYKELCITL